MTFLCHSSVLFVASALKDLIFFHASIPNISGQILVIPNGLGLKAQVPCFVGELRSYPRHRDWHIINSSLEMAPSINLTTRTENSAYLYKYIRYWYRHTSQ